MRIAVVGTGAIGSIIGGFLSKAGHDPLLVDQWPEHVEAMKQRGLHITGSVGEYTVPVRAIHLNELQRVREPFDMAFVCVKSYDTPWAVQLIAPYLKEEGWIVSAQNSLNEERIASVVGWGRTMGVVVTLGAGVYQPGHVVRTGSPERHAFAVGEVHGGATPRAQRVAGLLSAAGKSRVTTNLWGERWAKLAVNCMGNPMSGITGMSSAEVRQHPETLRVLIRIGGEVVRVGQALGYSVEPIGGVTADALVAASEGRGLEEVALQLTKESANRGEGRPSLLQDIMKGRRTEIDYLNGLIASLGQRFGIPTPFNSGMVALVREIEGGQRHPAVENVQPLLALLDGH